MAAATAQTSSESQQNGQTTAVASNGNGHVKNLSDMAVYEQYRNQVWLLLFSAFVTSSSSLFLQCEK